ncbi:TetR/AcrR family transcriptional regulator [uncultured Ferrimonas sp.]|uniref:TetR/AcrR family transcriptional regulator n=1 Tax=uncultured Ferrimonas sp. TaxID=432640 RepID=UPI00261ECF0B|nr:TetR/AcrR family transcriptional regulator [uncultured Ferrimonas sp.]
MARPRRNDHNREQLLDAGLSLLAQQGYHGTGLKQILDLVQVPKGSFYHYFDSKEHFVAQVIERYGQQVLAQMDKIASDYPQPRDQLAQIVRQGLQQYQANHYQHGCLLGSLAAELGHHNNLCNHAMLHVFSQFEQWLMAVIEQGQQQQQIRSSLPPLQLSQLFWDCWQGGLLRMQLQGSIEPMLAQMELLLQHVFVTDINFNGEH